ncbi:MAG: hypothetical protein JWN95_1937 [Frankiales bacterium]|nr:hypothetical protein [Frankiales bacterium]
MGPRGSRGKLIAAVVAGWLAVSVVVLLILLAVRGPGANDQAGSPKPTGAASNGASAFAALPAGWQRQAADDQTNCAAHSYGQVPAFFSQHPCERVHRELLTTTGDAGRPIVMASYLITFSQAATAAQFNALVTSDGTGNVSDLLREGVSITGSPKRLPPAAFFSTQSGTQVRVAEAAYLSGASDPNDATLKSLAQRAVAQLR